jgi:hypothetical protein
LDLVPKKGHQQLSAFLGILSPKSSLAFVRLGNAILLRHQSEICAAEDFFTAQPIQRDQNNILEFRLLRPANVRK